MPPQAVSHALEFIYTGRLNKRAGLHLASLDQVFLAQKTLFQLSGCQTVGAAHT